MGQVKKKSCSGGGEGGSRITMNQEVKSNAGRREKGNTEKSAWTQKSRLMWRNSGFQGVCYKKGKGIQGLFKAYDHVEESLRKEQ